MVYNQPMRPISASELGSYLYCRRAWWYRRQGLEPDSQEGLLAGTRLHEHHGRQVFSARLLGLLALFCLLAALAFLAAGLLGSL